MRRPRSQGLTAIGLIALAVAACASPIAPSIPVLPIHSVGSGGSAAPSHLAGPVDHIVVVVEENHGFNQIVGNPSATYINELIGNGALATNSHGVAHPSLPNYLALIGGSTFGVTSDCAPTDAGCHFSAASLPDRLEAAGLTWRGYFEDMPRPCAFENHGTYTTHHDPFVYFDQISRDAQRCAAHVVPLGALSADLARPETTPNFAFIAPGNAHNMHSGSIRSADRWLHDQLATVFASPAWSEGRTLLVLTFDEDDGSSTNHILTLFYGPPARTGFRSDAMYTHYSLLRTIDDLLGVKPIANDRDAAPMSGLLR